MIVSLYIYTESFGNTTIETVENFKNRVLADGGVFEADNCCIDTVQSLGGTFGNTVTAKRIELFEDEKISVTSSIQNINDISKVFTDYSQSFTIPASTNNNSIFKYWYENSLDNGFDQRLRYDGYIEIDTQTFRIGKWQLESATIKNNRIEDYKITFYGNLLTLTDKFKDDKLKDLNTLNNYSLNYTGANVLSRIKSLTTERVMFPFISSDRVWNIGGGGSGTDNINTNGHALTFRELYPAVNFPTILNAIEDKYNVNFSGTFLTDKRFTNAFLWLKNNEQSSVNVLGAETLVNILPLGGQNISNFFIVQINALTDTITVIDTTTNLGNGNITLDLTFATAVTSRINVYRNGIFYFSNTSIVNAPASTTATVNIPIDQSPINDVYTFTVQTSIATTYTGVTSIEYWDDDTGEYFNINMMSVGGSTTSNLNLTALAPDIKLTDLFSGILKAFNLTAFSEDGINFTLEQLENWYYLGGIKDFSEYTISDSFEFSRIKPYKKINFEYEKSEAILNRNFSDANSREYGDLSYTFNSDGSDYNIKLPFENLMFNNFGGTFQVSYALKSDLQKYVPKPVFLYLYGLQPATYHFNNGLTTTTETTYNMFGQDVDLNAVRHTNNWGIEISTFDFLLVQNTLFSDYYLAYLNNLYSLKSRMLKVKMRLPYIELLNLKLNDRIVIRDKRYVINQFTTDLTTFEVSMELIQDFRSVNFNNSVLRKISSDAFVVDIPTVSKVALTWTIDSDPDDMILSFEVFETEIVIRIKENTSGVQRVCTLVSNLNDKVIIVQDA